MNSQLHPSHQEPTCAVLYIWFNPLKGESFGDWEYRLRRALEDAGFEVDGVTHDDLEREPERRLCGPATPNKPADHSCMGSEKTSALTNFPVEQSGGITASGSVESNVARKLAGSGEPSVEIAQRSYDSSFLPAVTKCAAETPNRGNTETNPLAETSSNPLPTSPGTTQNWTGHEPSTLACPVPPISLEPRSWNGKH